ncbi:MAG: hypothetical protein HQL31_08970 [Planctomycetes bacterium]|nr:hypothetical protein [Planctomycetota bacterium]
MTEAFVRDQLWGMAITESRKEAEIKLKSAAGEKLEVEEDAAAAWKEVEKLEARELELLSKMSDLSQNAEEASEKGKQDAERLIRLAQEKIELEKSFVLTQEKNNLLLERLELERKLFSQKDEDLREAKNALSGAMEATEVLRREYSGQLREMENLKVKLALAERNLETTDEKNQELKGLLRERVEANAHLGELLEGQKTTAGKLQQDLASAQARLMDFDELKRERNELLREISKMREVLVARNTELNKGND